jgi:hypothetical protein
MQIKYALLRLRSGKICSVSTLADCVADVQTSKAVNIDSEAAAWDMTNEYEICALVLVYGW